MKKLARFTAVVSALVLAASTLAVSTSTADSATPTMDRINKTGVLRIGVSGTQPPFNFKTKAGPAVGLDVDLANALASSMGVKAEFVVMDFAELLPSVEAGRIDIAFSGITMTPERNRRVAFAGPYFSSGKGLLTTSAALAKADDPSDLATAPYTFVALDGSTSLELIEQLGDGIKAVAVTDYEKGVQKVLAGEADAMVSDFSACVVAFLQHPNAGLHAVVSPFTFEPLGAALSPNDALFLNLVQNYMNMLEGIGLMDALRAKWFESSEWLPLLP